MSSSSSVSAVRSSFGQVFGSVEVHTACAALTGAAEDLDVVDEVGVHIMCLLLYELADYLMDAFGYLLHGAVAVDGVVVTELTIVLCDRLCALVVDSESFTNSSLVIISPSACFASVDESLYDLLFVHL